MGNTATIPQFQRYVWESLPIRREVVDREFVDDLVLAVIQQWPSAELSEAEPGSAEEAHAMRQVQWDVRRIIEFVYGQERFNGYWLLGGKQLIPQVTSVVLQWWHRRKDNRAKIGIWRRRWVE